MDLKEETSMNLKEETFTDSKKTSMGSEEEASVDAEEETSANLEEESTEDSEEEEEASVDAEEETSANLEEESTEDSEEEIIVICPRAEAEVELRERRFHLERTIHGDPKEIKCEADTKTFKKLLQEEGTTYVYCKECYGNGHEECYKSSVIKHPLHLKHTLMFVRWTNPEERTRRSMCCEVPLEELFYWCQSCDFCINLDCVDKQPEITIDHPKRHEHTLTLFPRQTTLICNVCSLDHSITGSIYICPACDFVVHRRCIDLPWSIRISRHAQHRISFTSYFDLGDLICNICRRNINNECGGYKCNKEGCSYVAHSRCATRENVWDEKELEGVPEEVEEEVKPPFERLGDGTIRHFSHEHHPLKLNDGDTTRDYDEYRTCEACIKPIYEGNFYSCTMDCSFLLHEACADLSRRIYHAIHPHPLLLRTEYLDDTRCSTCRNLCTGFFYECSFEECDFRLDVPCATVYEPMIHKSHEHPLYLTSTPDEWRICSICLDLGTGDGTHETFNCIENGCDFSLCFECASLPQKARYKHDKHFLTLFYKEDTSETEDWCEICEGSINPAEWFYACDDYCCVTLHIRCLFGKDRNMKSGSKYLGNQILPNNRMTRPICSWCEERCNQKVVFQRDGLIYCSYGCSRHVT